MAKQGVVDTFPFTSVAINEIGLSPIFYDICCGDDAQRPHQQHIDVRHRDDFENAGYSEKYMNSRGFYFS